MQKSYRIVYEGGEGEIVEKKSRFIATVFPVNSEEEALKEIESLKKKYWDAKHNCSAYVIGKNREIMRFSDDGEPGGTAGKPMLDVLIGEELYDTGVVVTRYFGGTLLGTGGLVRAYQKAVQAGLSNSSIIEMKLVTQLCVRTDYNNIGKVQYLISQMGLKLTDSQYTEIVELNLNVPVHLVDEYIDKLNEATNGKANVIKGNTLYVKGY